jgi:lipopolysaccharide transport system ATP-binding protein
MSDVVIKVENLGKKYLIRHQQRERYVALRDVITNKFKSFGRRVLQPMSHEQRAMSSSKEEFWALKDVSFEVNQGDRVGIIGRNGAGKTTLLKLISRITEPTTGRITLKGRVASLLEVGTGFHPELTGRENIFLNGAILGMSKAEIRKKFDEIVAFAEVEKFLDTPVKRYSSGMYVRLAFAVAAHLEPEILIVDEVLAVGDAQFQRKCIGKMEEVGKEGRTILFVSHNMSAISTLCTKGMVILAGKIHFAGNPHLAISTYLISGTDSSYERRQIEKGDLPIIRRAWFENEMGGKTTQFYSGEPVYLIIDVQNSDGVPIEIALSFWDNLRRPLWNFTHAMHAFDTLPGSENIRIRLVFYPPKLTVSELLVDMAVGQKGEGSYYDHIINGLKCAIIEKSGDTVTARFPEWPIFCDAKMSYEVIHE